MFSAGKSGRIKETYRKKIQEENEFLPLHSLTTSLSYAFPPLVKNSPSTASTTHPPWTQKKGVFPLKKIHISFSFK